VRERPARAWVDFGVDETWEPAGPSRTRTRNRTRRERQVDSWVDDADLFAPRYGDDPEFPSSRADEAPLHDEDIAERPQSARAERPPARAERPAVRRERTPVREARPAARGERSAERDRRSSRRPAPHRGPYVVETEAGTVAVDVLAHPAHAPAAPSGARSADPGAFDDAPVAAGGVPGRRTVKIRGRGAERDLAFPEPGRARRPPVRRHERPGFRPDRAGLWALLLGVVLVLVAATSSHAATLSHARPAHTPARVAHVATAPTARVLVVRATH
jgi:hypothetical protein